MGEGTLALPRTPRASPAVGRGAWLAGGVLVGAVALGALGARLPVLFGVVVALGAGAGICAYAYLHPARALGAAFCLIPIAQTKFRVRSAAASASGEVDAQILLELGLYAVVGAIVAFAASRELFTRRPLGVSELLLGAYAGVALGSVLWTDTPTLTLVKGVQLATIYLLAVTALRVLGAEGALRAVALAVIPYVIVCSAIASTVPGTLARGVPHTPYLRFAWFFVHPISAAMLIGTAIIAIVTRTWFTGGAAPFRGPTLTTGLALAAMSVLLVLTRSRIPTIATGIAVLALVLRSRVPRWVTVAAATGALVLVGAYVSSGLSITRWLAENSDNPLVTFLLRDQQATEIAELSGRDELWAAASTLFRVQPVAGYGYGGARLLLLDAAPWAGDAHNALIQSLLDVGALGTLPLFAAIAVGLAAAFRGPARSAGAPLSWASAATLGYLVFVVLNASTDVCFAEPGFFFLLSSTAIIAAERLRAGRVAEAAR